MMHIPKNKRLKWDKKAIKLILVGYSKNTKGYRLYNPETGKICTSRDVVIMERSDNTAQMEINDLNKKNQQLVQEENSEAESVRTSKDQNDSIYVCGSEFSTGSNEQDSYDTLSE